MADDMAAKFGLLTLQLNRIVPIFQLIFGTFGNLMNIFIFTRRSLRTNSCSNYFLALSINNLFVLYVALLTRLLSSGWNIDPSQTNDLLCRLRIFFVYISLCLTQWFIVLASIDRYLSSCQTVRYRQLSNLSIARKMIIILVIVTTLAHFHTLIWWTSEYAGSIRICNIFNQTYDISFSIFYILFTCLLPPFFMLIFGIKTILNLKKIRTQVAPQNNNSRNERLHSKDRQLIMMLLGQVFLNIVFTTPFTMINLYSTINDNIETSSSLSPSAIVIYNFSANVCRLINYFNPVIGFYIYTLTGKKFRTEIKYLFGKCLIQIGFGRYLSENFKRNLFQHDQTLANSQSITIRPNQTILAHAGYSNRRSEKYSLCFEELNDFNLK